ncbi:MAG: hypothetical protein MUF87_17825 [Anaerolineae bacterium]|jgi:hypothetical protein|nr:hypothetical protein [Anaerolineae bacterium]
MPKIRNRHVLVLLIGAVWTILFLIEQLFFPPDFFALNHPDVTYEWGSFVLGLLLTYILIRLYQPTSDTLQARREQIRRLLDDLDSEDRALLQAELDDTLLDPTLEAKPKPITMTCYKNYQQSLFSVHHRERVGIHLWTACSTPTIQKSMNKPVKSA